jgi:polyphosphate kinase
VKFCAIFSSNLDEFFQVRVAGLLGQAEAGITVRSADGLTPQQALRASASECWSSRRSSRASGSASCVRRLQPRDHVGGIEDLGSKELRLERRFEREIYPC